MKIQKIKKLAISKNLVDKKQIKKIKGGFIVEDEVGGFIVDDLNDF